MTWQPMDTAPLGKREKKMMEIDGKQVERKTFIEQRVITASKCGKVFESYCLENGRWNGYAKGELPLAWQDLPKHPEAA